MYEVKTGSSVVARLSVSRLAAVFVCLLALVGCGDSGQAEQSEDLSSRELVIPPPVLEVEAGLVDSCELLAEADPIVTLGPDSASEAVRIDRVCILPRKDGLFEKSLQVELRRPEPLELEVREFPSNLENFWVAEGGGIDLVGGRRDELEEVEGVGDFAVWYPITDGMAFHAYWDGDTILAVNVRGIPVEKGLEWAKRVATSAIAKTEARRSEVAAGSAQPAADESDDATDSDSEDSDSEDADSEDAEAQDPDADDSESQDEESENDEDLEDVEDDDLEETEEDEADSDESAG